MTMMIAAAAAALMLLQQAPAQDTDWEAEFGAEERVRDPVTGEFPVDAYAQDNANAGAAPYGGTGLAQAFGGRDGITRIAARTVDLSHDDPRIAAIFAAHDMVRLKRTLGEQFCYLVAREKPVTG